MTLSVGLVGCGNWGRNILRDLLDCGARVSVAAPSRATRDRALALGAAAAFESIPELRGLDAYVVATPSVTHAATLDALLGYGKPVFVEKPMTTDVASARRLAAAYGGRLFVMQKWRYHPGIERIRAEIAAGRLGSLEAIRIVRWGWGMPHPDMNSIWHLMPHDLAVTQHWLGRVPPLRSVTVTSPGCTGVIAQLGGGADPLVTLEMSIASPGYRRWFCAIGSDATMELQDSYSPEITVRRGDPVDMKAPEEKIPVGKDMPLLTEIKAFLDHVQGGPPPISSATADLPIIERLAEIDARRAELESALVTPR